jgi:spore coat protein U-like protein
MMALVAWSHQAHAVDCNVSANPLSFGNYDTKADATSTTRITITCHAWGNATSVDYTLTASAGSGSYSNRQLFNGSNTISFNLYTSATDSGIWGDGSGDGTVTLTGTLTHKTPPVILTIYGLIRGGQKVVPGSYSTMIPITVTLTYQ